MRRWWQADGSMLPNPLPPDLIAQALPVLAQAMALSFGLIVAIGAQNAFVLRQGLRREHVGAVVLFCAAADAVLIAAGVLGMAQAIGEHPGVARALEEERERSRPVFICHDLTRLTRSYLIDDLADVVIDQNARQTAEQAVIQLLGSIASPSPFLTSHYIEPRLIFKENIPLQ